MRLTLKIMPGNVGNVLNKHVLSKDSGSNLKRIKHNGGSVKNT